MQTRPLKVIEIKSLAEAKEALSSVKEGDATDIHIKISKDWKFESSTDKDKPSEMESLAKILNQMPVKILAVYPRIFNGLQLHSFLAELAKSQTLESLSLYDCFSSDFTASMEALLKFGIPLKELNISYCRPVTNKTLEAITKCKTMHTLIADNYESMDRKCIQLLANDTSLQILSLKQNRVPPETFNLLLKNSSLRILHLPTIMTYDRKILDKAKQLINFSVNNDYKNIGPYGFEALLSNNQHFTYTHDEQFAAMQNFVRNAILLARLWEIQQKKNENEDKFFSQSLTSLPLEMMYQILKSSDLEKLGISEKQAEQYIQYIFDHKNQNLEQIQTELLQRWQEEHLLPRIKITRDFYLQIATLLKTIQNADPSKQREAESVTATMWLKLIDKWPYATTDHVELITTVNLAVNNIIKCTQYLEDYLHQHQANLIKENKGPPGLLDFFLKSKLSDLNKISETWNKMSPQILLNYISNINGLTFNFENYKNALLQLADLAKLIDKDNVAVKAYCKQINDIVTNETSLYESNKKIDLIMLDLSLPHLPSITAAAEKEHTGSRLRK